MAKTVNELIEELKQLPGELIVGLSSDEEGNSYHEWSGDFSFAVYNANAVYGDEFKHEVYDDNDEHLMHPIAINKSTATAVILWP